MERIESSETYNAYKKRYDARVKSIIERTMDYSDIPYWDSPMKFDDYLKIDYKTHEDTITGSKKTLIEKCKVNAGCINLDDDCAKYKCTRLLFEEKNIILDGIDINNEDAALPIEHFVKTAEAVVGILKGYANNSNKNHERLLFYIDTEILPWLKHFIPQETYNVTMALSDVYRILKAVANLELYID